jgi:hypothetical protein
VRAQRHLPRIADAGPDLDGEAGRQLDGFQRQGGGERGPAQQGEGNKEAHGSPFQESALMVRRFLTIIVI